MDLSILTVLTLNGLTQAGLLFITASGLTLAFGLMRVVNLAHGAFYMLGGYTGVAAYQMSGSLVAGVIAGGAVALLLGVFTERVLLVRIRGMELSEAMMTIAIGMIIADTMLAIFGGHPKSLEAPPELRGAVNLDFAMYPKFRLLILGAAVLLGIAMWLILSRTRIGAAIRAGVDDREAAESQGINIGLLFTLVFAFASFLAGIAGVIGASYLSLSHDTDVRILMLSLVVVILGGLGSITGAAVGAVITGLITSYASAFIPQFSLFALFLPLALILAFRPQGLFGREV